MELTSSFSHAKYVHRCGRAGRKHALNGGDVSRHPPTVYSFFPREFPGEYADSVVDLLKASNAWVDPNLLALTKRNKLLEDDSKRSGRKRKRRKGKATDGKDITGKDEEGNDSDNEFNRSLEKSSKKSGKKRRKNKEADTVIKAGKEEDDDDADKEFSFLGRIVLKRASHVSDAEDSDDESE